MLVGEKGPVGHFIAPPGMIVLLVLFILLYIYYIYVEHRHQVYMNMLNFNLFGT